jgi:hypothetical protein
MFEHTLRRPDGYAVTTGPDEIQEADTHRCVTTNGAFVVIL